MLSFKDWDKVFELKGSPFDQHNDKIHNNVVSLAQKLTSKYGKITVINKFETFVREGEPVQQKILFVTKEGNTMSANFTENGKIFSMDFWEKTKIEPKVTMYIKQGSINKISKVSKNVISDPRVHTKEEVAEYADDLNEFENEDEKVEVDFKAPPKKEILPPEEDALYDYGDPEILFEDLSRYVDMVIKGTQPSLVITGSPGVGKTFLVTSQVKKAKIPFSHEKGRSTAAGLYITLYENRKNLLIIDDMDSIFKSDDAVNILKGALDSYDERTIDWKSARPIKDEHGDNVPKSFEYEGSIIFISNLPQKKIDYAIKSRSFVIEVALRPEDMIIRMRNLLPVLDLQATMPVKRTALKMIERAYNQNHDVELSMRSLIKSIRILQEVDNMTIAKRLILQQCSYK